MARPDTEVITLGTGSALPSKYRNISATLVRVPGVGSYLFDCGENTLGQLRRMFPPDEIANVLRDLRVIWISHLHADHHLGTASVIKAWYQVKHKGVPNPQYLGCAIPFQDVNAHGLAVISHSGMLQWLFEYSSVEDFGYSRILPLQISPNEIRKSSELSILNTIAKPESPSPPVPRTDYEKIFGFADIQAARVTHCHGSMAVSITFPVSATDTKTVKPLKVSYSGDCRPCYHFTKIGTNTTILIHEATFDDELKSDAIAKKHSTTSEALGIGAKMNAQAVILTHFSQRYQKIPVLQSIADDEQDEAHPIGSTDDHDEGYDNEIDATAEDADNTGEPPSDNITSHQDTSLERTNTSAPKNERVVMVKNKDMKVAIAFDYMRVKIGDIIKMEKFNDALNELLSMENEEDVSIDRELNTNGKKVSGDESNGVGKKQKKRKSKRNN